jgi:diguanylate cyclase (GGDEF)-like protein
MNSENLFLNFQEFESRARQELKRAERYASYLSLVKINFYDYFNSAFAGMQPKSLDKTSMYSDISEFIFDNVRDTDIVSYIEGNRMMILLSETPLDGALTMSERLADDLQEYIASRHKFELTPEIPIEVSSFPNCACRTNRLLEMIDSLSYPEAV